MRSRGEGEIGAIIRRGARSTIAIDEGHDRRARSSDDCGARRSTSALAIAIDEGRDRRARSQSRSMRGALVGRSRRSSIASSLFFLSLSLSDLGSLFSLSLSLSLFFRK